MAITHSCPDCPALQELTLQHCNDLFGTEAGHWSLLGLLPDLRRLTVSDARFKATSGALAQLSCLHKVRHRQWPRLWGLPACTRPLCTNVQT